MIVEWLAPVSAFILSAHMIAMQVRLGWKGWEDGLRIVGVSFMSFLMIQMGFSATGSLVDSIVTSTFLLTLAFIPPRFVLRLIKAKRPNELEDPEMFENGELKPEVRDKLLADPTQRNDP